MFNVLVLKTREIEDIPAEVQIAPLGEFMDAQGRPFRVAGEEVSAIVAGFADKTNDRVIDYEHQTLSGAQAPAAGWIKSLVNKGKDGLWGVVEWTERAKEYLKNREYRYLSPVLLADRKDKDGFYRPSALHSAALTNTPQIDGMVPIVNKRTQNEKGERPMEKVTELLGLKPEAAEDDIAAAVEIIKNKAVAQEVKEVIPKDLTDALGLKEGASLSEAKATVLALKQPGNVVSMTEFQGLKKRLAEKDRDELVALAMKEGKITAAQKEWAEKYALEDAEGFKVFVMKAPVVVPPGSIAGGGAVMKPGEIDEQQALINKQLGITNETFKKHNQA